MASVSLAKAGSAKAAPRMKELDRGVGPVFARQKDELVFPRDVSAGTYQMQRESQANGFLVF